ncbi:unnamed protein product, partial [Ectocarpus fasciculatus]
NLAELTESRKAAASSSCSCRPISEAAGCVPEGEGRRFRARAGQGESDRRPRGKRGSGGIGCGGSTAARERVLRRRRLVCTRGRPAIRSGAPVNAP